MTSAPKTNRRTFLKGSLLPAAAWPLTARRAQGGETGRASPGEDLPVIVDTNVHLFDWPFRRLKYARTGDLVEKLRGHRVVEAWAGSFEALLHKNLQRANERLAEECRRRGEGMLVPFGTVHPLWPDWEEELRRCHEIHGMPGIRLNPSYHNYSPDHPECVRLLRRAARRSLLVQIVVRMEDPRVHHPIIDAPPVEAGPLSETLGKVPEARVQLLNGESVLREAEGVTVASQTDVFFDISHLEANGAVGRLIDGNHWSIRAQVAAERLLFGSHAPYFPCENALLKLFESPLDRAHLKAVMSGNARRVLAEVS